jgi:hypothetical protein
MADLGGKAIGSGFIPLNTSASGLKTSIKVEDDKLHILKEQQLAPVLDYTARVRNECGDGYNQARDMRRVAHLPFIFIDHCRTVEGWDPLSPENHDRLARVLNDPDYAFLRTAPGRIGYSNGVMR